MTDKTIEGWNVLDEEGCVLWRQYRFSKQGVANTLVFKGKDGLVVMSPGTGFEARELDALKDFGEVRALVANNVFHHLGQPSWRKHFPDAISYAPAGALPRLAKQAKGIPFESLEKLELPDHARVDDAPGMRSGEAIATVKSKKGWVWYAGDLLANFEKLPAAPVKWLFSWTNSGPGFRLFKLAAMVLVKDKKRTRAWTLERLAETPPAVVVPAHGAPVATANVAELTKAQIERL